MTEALDLLLRLTIILACGQALVLAARQAPAAFRLALIRLTLAASVLCVLAALMGLKIAVPLLPPAEPAVEAVWLTDDILIRSGASGTPLPKDVAERYAFVEEAAAPRPSVLNSPVLIWGAWGAGVLVMLGGLAGSWLALIRLRRSSRSLDGSEDQGVLEAAAGKEVALASEGSLSTALTFGLARHTVLVPRSFGDWSATTKTSVLLHEAAHIRRFDCAWNAIALVFRAALWFHPLAWTLARAQRRESELAADEMAIAMGVAPADYAESLLSVAAFSHLGAKAPQGAITMNAHPLSRRIKAALKPARRISTTGAMALLAVTAGVFLAAATTFAGPKEEQRKPNSTAVAQETKALAPNALARVVAPSKVQKPAAEAQADQLRAKKQELRQLRRVLGAKAKDPAVRKILKQMDALEAQIAKIEKNLAAARKAQPARAPLMSDPDRRAMALAEVELAQIQASAEPLTDSVAPIAAQRTFTWTEAKAPAAVETRAFTFGQPDGSTMSLRLEGSDLVINGVKVSLPKNTTGKPRTIRIDGGKVFIDGKEVKGVVVSNRIKDLTLRDMGRARSPISPAERRGASQVRVEGRYLAPDLARSRTTPEAQRFLLTPGTELRTVEGRNTVVRVLGSEGPEARAAILTISGDALIIDGKRFALPKKAKGASRTIRIQNGKVFVDGKELKGAALPSEERARLTPELRAKIDEDIAKELAQVRREVREEVKLRADHKAEVEKELSRLRGAGVLSPQDAETLRKEIAAVTAEAGKLSTEAAKEMRALHEVRVKLSTEAAKEIRDLRSRAGRLKGTFDGEAKGTALKLELQDIQKALGPDGELARQMEELRKSGRLNNLRTDRILRSLPKVEVKGNDILLNGKKVGTTVSGKPVEVRIENGVVTINGKKVEETKPSPDIKKA